MTDVKKKVTKKKKAVKKCGECEKPSCVCCSKCKKFVCECPGVEELKQKDVVKKEEEKELFVPIGKNA